MNIGVLTTFYLRSLRVCTDQHHCNRLREKAVWMDACEANLNNESTARFSFISVLVNGFPVFLLDTWENGKNIRESRWFQALATYSCILIGKGNSNCT